MLFNSFGFRLVFLPVSLLIDAMVRRRAPLWRPGVLLFLSFLFYGYWDWRFVPLLGGSVVLNWLVAKVYLRAPSRALIALAIALNLAVLALFKYFNFFAEIANNVLGLALPKYDIILPLGISFFTFHHIMYLTDL